MKSFVRITKLVVTRLNNGRQHCHCKRGLGTHCANRIIQYHVVYVLYSVSLNVLAMTTVNGTLNGKCFFIAALNNMHMLFVLHTHNVICIRMSNENEENISIFHNIPGRTHTTMHMTNSDMSDTIINATCQCFSGTITLDISDHRLIIFLKIIKKSKQCQLWQLCNKTHINYYE